jgi:tetratricopeptide (TPR) repeat protein
MDVRELHETANALLKAYRENGSLENYSDYGAALIYLGEYGKAMAIYKEIEDLSPNLYTTASNVGTIYELIGQPDSALFWIKKSMRLNPDSHGGSEWIHLKILEHKLNGNQLKGKSILGLDFGDSPFPENPNNYDLKELRGHIWHQLRERTKFVKPKNETVGNIYFDLGNVIAQIFDVQAALESYDEALEYGFESTLMESRTVALQKLSNKARPSQIADGAKHFISANATMVMIAFLIGFILFVILVLKIRAKLKTKG